MSKKNLARSAIEGGRYGRNKWERRYSHNEERNAAKEYCKQAIRDPEAVDERDLIENKSKVYKDFKDKLSPMYRWLRAQVGKSWDEVRSEVFKKFDARTTAGRHILFDHLLKSVETESTPFPYYFRWDNLPNDPQTSHRENDFYVDKDGFLQERRYISKRSRGYGPINHEFVANWLNGRIVGWEGNKYYWYTPAAKDGWIDEWKCQWTQYGKLTYLHREYQSIINNDRGKSTFKPIWVEPHYFVSKNVAVKQGDEFSDKDLEIWFQIPDYYRKQILEYFPRNK